MTIKITPNDRGNPPGKLADAELHFSDGPLEGLKLIGFSIWEQARAKGHRNVTFPARQYNVNGERRSFALLRPIVDINAMEKIRELILDTYAEWEAQQERVHGSTDAGNTALIGCDFEDGIKRCDAPVVDGTRKCKDHSANTQAVAQQIGAFD